jgi:spermidine/putrescine transport system ATP-binding protein
MSDRVGVMSQAQASQVANPREIYNRPTNGFVASFVGENNILTALQMPVTAKQALPPQSALSKRGLQARNRYQPETICPPEHTRAVAQGRGKELGARYRGDVSFEGPFIVVSATSENGTHLTAELRTTVGRRFPAPARK